MPLIRDTDYGKIIVSDELFKDTIERACNAPECDGNIWLAGKPNIKAEFNEDGRILLEFSATVKFGSPINETCTAVADDIARQIESRSGQLPSQIKVNVTGVKSKAIVKRSMEVICEY